MALENVRIHTSSRHLFLLVVDSDDGNRSAVSKLLERFQYKVFPARNVREALDVATVITPVLVVASQRLEGSSALDLVNNLKKEPAMRTIPVIILSDRADPAADRACLTAGAATCLSTPVSIEDLYRVIQVAIEPVPRMNLRIRTKLPAIINGRALDFGGEGGARDLSEQGMSVRTDQPFPLKTVLPIEVQLGQYPVSAKAEVIYCRKEADGLAPVIGLGFQFVEISRPDQMRIRVFIRDEMTRGIQRV